MTQDKIQEALKDFNHNLQLKKGHPYDFCIVRLLPSSVEIIRQALQSQPHTCTASGYECKSKDDKVDIEIELTDEAIISLALYAHRHDITINDAFTQLVRLGVDTDELPPVNEATGHDTE